MSDDDNKKGTKVFHLKDYVPTKIRSSANQTRKRSVWGGQRHKDAIAQVHAAFKPVTELSVRSSLVRRAVLALPMWITSNRVTLFRTLLLAPLIAYLEHERYYDATLLYGFMKFLDFVDGAIAKNREHKTGEEAVKGKVYDSTADKIVNCGVLIYLMANNLLQSAMTVGLVLITCTFAALNIGLRLYKLVLSGNSKPEVGASDAGKLKLVTETIAILLMLQSLSTGSGPTMEWATLVLAIATVFAVWSFRDQCRGL